MTLLQRFFISFALMACVGIASANVCGTCTKEPAKCPKTCDKCCGGMGGVRYCDSSAGRLVCNNGSYSTCYCDRHAVMDLEHLQGCCLWQGGVYQTDNTTGMVICNNGSVSEVCTMQDKPQAVANF